jgi:hypothetical protein
MRTIVSGGVIKREVREFSKVRSEEIRGCITESSRSVKVNIVE